MLLINSLQMRGLGLLLLCSAAVYAQEFRATLSGRISDPAGAPVASASVVLRNVENNETVHRQANDQGDYLFALINPGEYELRVEHPGFKAVTRRGITLSVARSASLDVALELGSTTERVTVTAEVSLLDTESGDRGGLIDGQTIREMPLNGRNPFMLGALVAGVDYNGSLAYTRPFDNGAGAQFGINGATSSAEFLLDGAPNNAQAGNNNIAYVPPVDSVQEFKIQTNSYDAQYGKSSGGVMNVVLKSGTNALHGSVYEFARRNAWDANSFQNNARGAPKDGHYLDQYGALLDGPVVLPHVYNGRNHTFFLVNWEGYRENSPQPLILSVPTPEMRNGDFSKLVDSQGRQIVIYDPAAGANNSTGQWIRAPFPGNIIPQNRINPIAQKILSFFPQPNVSTAGSNYATNDLFLSGGANPAIDSFYNLVIKIDHNINEKHRFFVRYAWNNRTETRITNGVNSGPGQDGNNPLKRINNAAVFDWLSTLTPSLIFNARLSFARYVEASWAGPDDNFDITTLGFPAKLAAELPYGGFFGRYNFDGYQSLGKYPGSNITNTFTVAPNITWIRGAKTLKAGVDLRWIQYSTQNYGNILSFSNSTSFTQQDYQHANALSGNSIASWLLGTPSSGSVTWNVFPIYMFRYFAPWVQYDWKVTPRLTVNLGLREDLNVPPHERYNRMNRGFDPNAANPIDGLVNRKPYVLPAVTGSLLFAGVNGVPVSAADLYGKTVQPRAGFAYSLNSKTVVRGGWGRYFINPNNDYLQTNGFTNTTPLVFSANESRLPLNNKLNDPFPDGILAPTGSSAGALTMAGRSFNYANPEFRIPHVNTFSFSIQRMLSGRSRVEVAYAGSRGVDLQDSKTVNNQPASLRDGCNYYLHGNPSYCDKTFGNPFANIPAFLGTSDYSSTSLSRYTLSAPNPEFSTITELMRNDGKNWYNSLQTTYSIRNRWTTLNANYTFSKNVERNGFLDPVLNVMQEGLTSYDRPHHFVMSAVTQLPLGTGRRGLAGKLLRGWENSVIFQTQTGTPWALPTDIIYLKDARIPINWDTSIVQGVKPCVEQWNNDGTITMQPFSVQDGCTSANFLVAPRYSPRYEPNRDGRLRGQGFHLVDASLNKTTSINERYRVQFRAEVFNALNSFFIANQGFDKTATSSTFGSIVKAAVSAPNSNYPRQIQMAVKLLW